MKKTIAVIFGGQSPEHDVSIITAHIPIIQSLMASDKFDVWPIYIAKDGSWYADKAFNDLAYFKDPDFETKIKAHKKVQLLFDDGLKIIWPGFRPKTLKIDIVFPAMHGALGEDGSLMGVLRMANIPFVGCDLSASAVAMDKALTKQVLAAEGLPVVPYIWFTKTDWEKNKKTEQEKLAKLKWPLFIKPVHLGSSIGITKAKEPGLLENAIEVGFHYDDKILIEESVENLIEVTLPIMGNDELKLGAIERPLNKTEFFDFNDKYLSGAGGKSSGGVNNQYSEIPAKIDPDLAKQIESLAQKTYRVLGCSGIVRVDFLIDNQEKKVYVNEINTLPGSLYHHNWRTVGLSGVDLVTKLVALAEERFATKKEISHTFTSSILSKVGGPKIGT